VGEVLNVGEGLTVGVSAGGSSIIWNPTESNAVVALVVSNPPEDAVTIAKPIALRLIELDSSRKKSFFKSDSRIRKHLLDPRSILDDVRALPLLITG